MCGRKVIWMLLLFLSGACLLYAATEITVDWETGQVDVQKEATSEPEESPPEPSDSLRSCTEDNRRLQRIIRTQHTIIMQQQKKLQELQAVVRRQQNVIRGLDMLRRQEK